MTTEIENLPAPTFWQSLKAWLIEAGWALKEGWEWGTIYEFHRKAGNPNPRLATEQEIYYRGEYIERFRDLASDAYMDEGTDLEEVKKNFIKDRLSAKTTIEDTAATASLRAVIRDMPLHFAYHEWALAKYMADLEQWQRETMAEAERLHGKGGYTALERRVLRGRN